MSAPGDWSVAPPARPADDDRHAGSSVSDREARRTSATSAVGRADGRVHGTPAPSYGEYAPEGWVNPVLVEQERREREAESRALREQAAREAVESGRSVSRAGVDRGGAVPAGRLGASGLDFAVTVGLLVIGVWTVLGTLDTGKMASNARALAEQRFTAMAHPGSMSVAAAVIAVSGIVLIFLTVWLSISRLRRRKWSLWVPVLGAAVWVAVLVVVLGVAILGDPAIHVWLQQRRAG